MATGGRELTSRARVIRRAREQNARALLAPTALLLCSAVALSAQEQSLDEVLDRATAYVLEFQQQLSGIVAEETYVQKVEHTRPSVGSKDFPGRLRTLKSDFLLVRPISADRYVEFRDVFEVDGGAVRDRDERLSRLFLDADARNLDQARAIVIESARYNIGNIPRTVNTPMLPLMFFHSNYRHRFTFKRQNGGSPRLRALAIGGGGSGSTATFRTTAEMWVIEFRERGRNTVIRSIDGRDFPAAGRFWINPASGAILMTELDMQRADVRALINVSYQSEPLLGFNVPVEMREKYETKYDRVDGIATYGRFRRFQVNTDQTVVLPDPAARKPPR
jgi:hypothetical protein